MSLDQILLFAILAGTVAMFLWGRWRHDMVAGAALMAAVAAGLVPVDGAFAGFGHPAVITVACVLILSQGLQNTGAVDLVARRVLPVRAGPTLSIAAITALAAVLSAFMNNVGALALLMPVALQMADKLALPPGRVLMPLAFGSILGGMTTLIGTPPNLIVSGFRAEAGNGSFAMFDFAPVGLAVAGLGVLFVALVGWRLVPARKRAGVDSFETAAYLTEVRLPAGSKADGMSIRDIEARLEDAGAQVVGLVRNEVKFNAPNPTRKVRVGDILVIEAEADSLGDVLAALGARLEEDRRGDTAEDDGEDDAGGADDARSTRDEQDGEGDGGEVPRSSGSEDIVMSELAVLPGSALVNRTPTDTLLRSRYNINILAVSREGTRSISRLRNLAFQAGDVLLVQGPQEALGEFASNFGCVPLAARELRIPDRRKLLASIAIMALAIAGAALGLVPAAASFAAGVLASMAIQTVPPRTVYQAVDWPVVVLLAALIPVAAAMESTGAAELLARWLVEGIAQGHAVVGLVLILVVTMTLSDLMNNAATAAVMCPIAIGIASQLGVSADPYLMAVAIGASCAFLTPIGHQNNTLILGPGGFRFGDYWRLGLPLELLVIAVSVPMLLWIWPL
ncbi:MAG: SLC13 family permease [Xanthomonadales bacterium]|nr:SLC13 family permease [Xanthomonadales bacterium]